MARLFHKIRKGFLGWCTYAQRVLVLHWYLSNLWQYMTDKAMAEILVIDDDLIFNELMEEQIIRLGHDCETVTSLYQGLERAQQGAFDVIFLDVTLPDGNGLKEIQYFKDIEFQPEIVIITGYGDPEGAEVAIKNGAWDYIQKPASVNTIQLTISRVLRYRLSKLHSEHQRNIIRDGIIGNSPKIRMCLELVVQAASSNINVLITGDTGTGKELFAKAIHRNSKRSEHPFIVADCTSIPETLAESLLFGHQKGSFTGANCSSSGLFLQADQGTLFLDEIGDLSLPVQKSFLRVLQEKRFRPLGAKDEKHSSFRLISATNRNLEKMITKGVFRNDLYYRIRTMNIHLPPLRERKEDVMPMLEHYIPKACKEMDISMKSVSSEFFEACLNYDWPGNVRELVNTVNIACSNALDEEELFINHLPVDIRVHLAKLNMNLKAAKNSQTQTSSPNTRQISSRGGKAASSLPSTYKERRREVVDRMEGKYLREVLEYTNKDFKQACTVTGLSRARLYELLKKHSISVRNF